MGWTRGILARWAQLGALSSGNSRGRLKGVGVAVIHGRSRRTARCRAFHRDHVAAQMEDLYNSLAGVPGFAHKTSRTRHPYSLCSGVTFVCIHRERAEIPVSDNYYPTLQPVAVP